MAEEHKAVNEVGSDESGGAQSHREIKRERARARVRCQASERGEGGRRGGGWGGSASGDQREAPERGVDTHPAPPVTRMRLRSALGRSLTGGKRATVEKETVWSFSLWGKERRREMSQRERNAPTRGARACERARARDALTCRSTTRRRGPPGRRRSWPGGETRRGQHGSPAQERPTPAQTERDARGRASGAS